LQFGFVTCFALSLVLGATWSMGQAHAAPLDPHWLLVASPSSRVAGPSSFELKTPNLELRTPNLELIKQTDWWATVQAHIEADILASLPPLASDDTAPSVLSGLTTRAPAPPNFASSVGGLNDTPALTLTGEATGNAFGYSVASAGDVNGDGYSDLVVGAQGYLTNTGRAYVYHGSASGLSPTPALTLTGDAMGANFGISVASVGDVNGDGYSDLVVGASVYSGNTGRAYVYHGNAGGLSATPTLTLTGEVTGNYFGGSVASAGDLNGDGYADLVVGAWGYSGNRGRAYVYHGSAGGLNATPMLTLTGEANSYFGYSVAGAGDLNGDGYADLVIGAHFYNSGTGRAYVYHGSASGLSPTPMLTLTGEATADYFGFSVASAGDVNGDGYSDLVVGAYGYIFYTGRAYVYLGNDGQGVAVRPLMRRANDSAPIATLGASDSGTSFRLAALGRSPFGRGKVKLEWEVKPLGTLFNGANTQRSATWLDSGTTGAALNELVTGLSARTAYHWRVRVLYHPATTLLAQHSRWFTQPWRGWNETQLRTAALKVYLPLVVR
jgi:hypothetical protein